MQGLHCKHQKFWWCCLAIRLLIYLITSRGPYLVFVVLYDRKNWKSIVWKIYYDKGLFWLKFSHLTKQPFFITFFVFWLKEIICTSDFMSPNYQLVLVYWQRHKNNATWLKQPIYSSRDSHDDPFLAVVKCPAAKTVPHKISNRYLEEKIYYYVLLSKWRSTKLFEFKMTNVNVKAFLCLIPILLYYMIRENYWMERIDEDERKREVWIFTVGFSEGFCIKRWVCHEQW